MNTPIKPASVVPAVVVASNPYRAPRAGLRSERTGTRLYSPLQVAGGAFVGGPIGLVYFLWANFRTLGNELAAQRTVLAGVALMVLLIVALPILPERFPSWPITLFYVLTGRFVAEKLQFTKAAIADSPEFDFHSSWRVVGLGLICLIASLVLLVGPILALAWFGIWDPMDVMAQ